MDMEEQTVIKLPGYDAATLDNEFGKLHKQVEEEAVMLETEEGREAFRLHWLGRKQGKLKAISDVWLKNAPSDKKGIVGQRFNELKTQIGGRILAAKLKQGLELLTESGKASVIGEAKAIAASNRRVQIEKNRLDITLPGSVRAPGIPHPLLKTMNEIVAVFHHLGYSTALGPQVESDFYNFEALNFPPNHPARDTQDTLLLAGQQAKPSRDRLLMRTHTSPVQIRSMIAQTPPIRIVVPGKVHRNDAADATHSPIFHQVEGLCGRHRHHLLRPEGNPRPRHEGALRLQRQDALLPQLLPLHRAQRRRADLVHLLRRRRLPPMQALRLDRASGLRNG